MRRDIFIIFILAVLFGAMSCSRKAVDDYPELDSVILSQICLYSHLYDLL